MPKQIRATNPKSTAVYRIIGKDVFLKCSDMTYAASLIEQIKSKGGSVMHRRGWMKCDLLGGHKTANLVTSTIDIENDSDQEVEDKFCEFFTETLKKAKFVVEVSDL